MSCRNPDKFVPYWYIVNRGYISANQDVLNNVIIANNYLWPTPCDALALDQDTVAPSSTPVTQQGTFYMWGFIPIQFSYPSTSLRKIDTGVKCIKSQTSRDFVETILVNDAANGLTNEQMAQNASSGKNPVANSALQSVKVSPGGCNPVCIGAVGLLGALCGSQCAGDQSKYLRKVYISDDPKIASPDTDPDSSYISSTYYIKYNTDPVNGGVFVFDTCNPGAPFKPISTDSGGIIGPDTWLNQSTPSAPYSPLPYHLIQNIYHIKTRHHFDQSLIMDPSNNIFLDHLNLEMGVTVIYYSGYAAKILPNVEPFKSLLKGYPIDFIQSQLNIFSLGLSDQSLDATNVPAANLPAGGLAGPVSLAAALATTTTKSPYDPSIITNIAPVQLASADNKLYTTKLGYSGPAKPIIHISIFSIIKVLWDNCVGDTTRFPVMGFDPNSTATPAVLVNIEAYIPDFSKVTMYVRTVYRCYFWALNVNNQTLIKASPTFMAQVRTALVKDLIDARLFDKNLPNGTLSASLTANIPNGTAGTASTVTPPPITLENLDYSYYVDAAAYYKALYDNNYNSRLDQFQKPNVGVCRDNCGTVGTSSRDLGVRYPPCQDGCGSTVFCVNKSPNSTSNSFKFNGRNIDPTGYVFCAASGGKSNGTTEIKIVTVPPVPLPPPPPVFAPSVPPVPRLTIATLRPNQTFLCESRSLQNVYKYTAQGKKVAYTSLGIAQSYTPEMDVTNSMWVWKNSLDGITTKCNQIETDFSVPSISCPNNMYCGPSPSSTNTSGPPPLGAGDQVGDNLNPEDGDNDEEGEGEEEVNDNSSVIASIMCSGIILFGILMLCSVSVVIFIVMSKKQTTVAKAAKVAKLVAKPVAKVGGFLQYYYDN
jgi:hypothetical protein